LISGTTFLEVTMNVFDHGQRPTSRFSPVVSGAGQGFLEWALRALGALSLLAVGAVHLQQYFASTRRSRPVMEGAESVAVLSNGR
jgi:hypothetical protein